MFKKLLLAGGIVFVGAVLWFGTSLGSYVRTSAGYVNDAVQESVPMDFQINRARDMLADLAPEIRRNMHLIAKEEVELRRLEEQIAQSERQLAEQKSQMLQLKTDLTGGKTAFRYAGRNYTPDQVKSDLAARFQRYKTNEQSLACLQQIAEARRKAVAAAQQRLDGMLTAKRQLEVEIENISARSQMAEAVRAAGEYQFDESRLGRVKELIAQLKTRVEVSEKLSETDWNAQGEIPLEKTSADSIVDEVTAYFQGELAAGENQLATHSPAQRSE